MRHIPRQSILSILLLAMVAGVSGCATLDGRTPAPPRGFDETYADNRTDNPPVEASPAVSADPSSDPTDLYALLINGDTSVVHNENVVRAYHRLRELGLPDDRIVVLTEQNPRGSWQLPSQQAIPSRATAASVAVALAYLARTVDDNDYLLIYTTGHGDRDALGSTLCLVDGELPARQFVAQVEQIPSSATTVVMDQCYSGGFADAFADSPSSVAVFTNTDASHTTYCEFFSRAFWYGLGNPEVDLDSDGVVTIHETYLVAMAVHRECLADTPEQTNGQYLPLEPGAMLRVSLVGKMPHFLLPG